MLALVKSRQVERILVKDLSRLGRNYIETGRFIDLVFPRYDTQLIAVNENFDSNGGDRFLVAVWNLMNELYAMDISNKQKQSIRARSDSGRHITSKIPFGYKLDPNDKHRWIIDKPAAETVQIIFQLYNEGKSIKEICRYLSEHKYLSPSNHSKQIVKGSRAVSNPYYWCSSSVQNILERQEYCGDTVNFKTYHTSFKDKQIRRNHRDDYVIIEDTQEPIISREVYQKAMERKNANKRVITEKKYHLLDGLVFCGECRRKMYLNCQHRKGANLYVYLCSSYKKGKTCSAHYIQETILVDKVLDRISSLQKMFSNGKTEFCRYVAKAITNRTADNIKQVKNRIDEIEKRIEEIRHIETTMYEEKIMGKINEDVFRNVSYTLNEELNEFTEEKSQLIIILDKVEDMKNGIDDFVQKMERFAEYEITNEDRLVIEQLIDHVEIHENESGEISVRIYFADIGAIE